MPLKPILKKAFDEIIEKEIKQRNTLSSKEWKEDRKIQPHGYSRAQLMERFYQLHPHTAWHYYLWLRHRKLIEKHPEGERIIKNAEREVL